MVVALSSGGLSEGDEVSEVIFEMQWGGRNEFTGRVWVRSIGV